MEKHPFRKQLEAMRNPSHALFSAKLSPDQDPDRILGIKSPALKAVGKEIRAAHMEEAFLRDLPHYYFEENLIHAWLISQIRDFAEAAEETERFLPYIDDWAVTDTLRPKVFAKNTELLEPYLKTWLKSKEPYVIRLAIGFYMAYYLSDAFRERQMNAIARIRSDHYYVRMMAAWYMATALCKQREAAMAVLKSEKLDVWTHNKSIQKAIESYRISDEDKALLRTMKRRDK